MLTVEHNGPVVRVLEGDHELYTARVDAIPPENIVYVEDGIVMIRRVDRSSDADLIHAIVQRQKQSNSSGG